MTFPDFPEAGTQGNDKAEAYAAAVDCLDSVVGWRMQEKREIPKASAVTRGLEGIPLSLEMAPKAMLYIAMRKAEISNSELARRLSVRETEVRRMLDPNHHGRPDKIQRALTILGVVPELQFKSA